MARGIHPLTVTAAPPAPAIITFDAVAVGVDAAAAQQLTASFSVSGYSGSFTPTATLHYGNDYVLGSVTCTAGGASETCNVPVTFQPSLPGARKDAIFLMDGSTRLATVLLGGVGQAPFSLLQPGTFTTSVPTNSYIYQSVADENGVVYILPSGNSPYIESVTKGGVAAQIPLSNPPYFWTIGIDGAGVLYLFNETSTVTTYDTVQGLQGTYQIPAEAPVTDATTSWFPGAVGVDGSIYVVNQIRNNGVAYALKPDGTTAYADVFSPGVLQPFTAAVDSDGDFFVGGYEINKITPAGVQTQVNTVGASEGLAVDAADTLYATRYNPTDGVAELPKSDYSTPIASFGRSSPLGMSLGSDGTLYVSNYLNLDIFDRSSETIDFGEVDATKSQQSPAASVYNGGNQPLTISDFSLSGQGFSLDPKQSNECTPGAMLAPGALCQVGVIFTPGHPGIFSGTISVTSNSLNSANTAQTIQLTGTSYGSYDVLSPNPLVFASQSPGTSVTQAVTLTNEGNSYASTIYSVATDNPAFTIAQGTCSGVAVQVGSDCQLQVTFSPTATQAYTGNATIVTYVSGTGQAFQTITLPLSGSSANPPAATPIISPGTGTYTGSQQVTIIDATTNSTIFYTTDGSIPSTNSTKYTGAIAVSANETVNAIATATGFSQSATASATYSFQEQVATVTPASLAFGNQVQGIASVAQSVTLKNTGIGTLTITGFLITGSADFSQTNNCAGSLAAGSSCALSIVYTPTSLGDKTATLTVNSDSIKAAPTVSLTGTGIVQPPVLTISPAALDFGNQIVNTSSAAQSVTVTNNSKTDTVVLAGVFTTSSVALAASSPNCSSSLAPGMSCTVSVAFSPSAIQAFTGTVTLQPQPSGCGGCTRNYPAQTIAVTGAGIAQPPVLTISPPSLAFGNQVVNTNSAVQSVTVTNNSKTDTVVLGGIFTTSSVVLTASSSNCSSPLAPGMSCTVSVTFSPSAIQAFTGTVTLQPQLSGCGLCTRNYPAQTIAVTGAGIAQPPVLTISPPSLAFGNQVVNTSSAAQSVTVTNISKTDTVVVGSIALASSGFLIQPSSCSSPIAPGMSCTIPFIFTPGAVQAYSATVTIQVQPSGCGGCTGSYPAQTFTVTGTGVAQPPVLTISPASLDFGNQIVDAEGEQSVTLTNNSKTDTVVLSSVTSSDPAFQDTSGSYCYAPVAPGMSCTIPITFAPAAIKAYSATVTIQVQPTGCGGCTRSYPAQTFTVTGTGVKEPPAFAFSPASLDFGDQIANIGGTKTITVTNISKTETVVFEAGSSSDGAFLVPEPNGCSIPMPPGGSCALNVTFLPTAAKAYSGTLTFGVEDLGCKACTFPMQSYSVTGTGIILAASLSPASMTFIATTDGTTSAPQIGTLTNNGSVPLTVLNISIGGLSPNDYSQTNNCGALLAVGASCTISVTFTPANPGSYPATLTVSDNDPASPQTINLTGSGSSTPDFVVASSTPPQMILPGGSAEFSLTVTAQNGATIPAVTLKATGLPPGATAAFSQTTVTPGNTSATSTLTIQTSATIASSTNSPWPLATPVLALVGLFFIPAKRRKRWASLAVMMVVSLSALTALSGCGAPALPPAKSYNVTITATIGTVQQTCTVKLAVR